MKINLLLRWGNLHTPRHILHLKLLWPLVLCASASYGIDYPPQQLGGFGIGHTAFQMNDVDRNRNLDVDVWYPNESDSGTPLTSYALDATIDFQFPSTIAHASPPVAEGIFPLIVSSHGTGLYSTSQASVNERLASHGFVVVALNHTGNSFRDADRSETDIAEDRILDVGFAIDEMLNMSAADEGMFSKRIDGSKIGAKGLSYGGVTAVAAHTGSASLGVERDARIKAIMPITSGFFSWMGLSESNLDITVPTLILNGTRDITNSANQRVFDNLTVEPRYEVIIDDAVHLSYMDVCSWKTYADENDAPSPVTGFFDAIAFGNWSTCADWAIDNDEAIDITATYAVSFFKSYLEGNREFLHYLTSESAETQELPVSVSTFGHVEMLSCDYDFDANGKCDVADLDRLLYVGLNSQDLTFDLDNSGTVDLLDRDVWLESSGTVVGDFNLDGRVASDDLNSLALNWRNEGINSYSDGDANGDGVIGANDLNSLALNWQFVAESHATPIPEPCGQMLLLLGTILSIRALSTRTLG